MSQPKAVASDAMLERVIREHGALLARVARGYADNAHDADDLMQEIWTALWRALPRFRADASERTFVLRVAHNRGISFAVARRRFASLGEAADVSDPAPIAETRVIAAERRDRLFDAIRRLPDTQREAVMLQLEGLSQREIAHLQGTSESNAGVRLTRARKALRALLGEE